MAWYCVHFFYTTSDDTKGIVGDPLLPPQNEIVVPRVKSGTTVFADGSDRIRQTFERLVSLYGKPETESNCIDQADVANSPTEDILQTPRNDGSPNVGAYGTESTEHKITILLFWPSILASGL